MSAPAWMKFFPNDYLGDTAHLTTWEHGAYLLLIIHAWKRGGEVHRSKAYAVARAVTPAERETVDRLLAEFFTAAGENFSHGRVKTELANAAELRAKRAEFGAKGGATRWAKGTQVDSKSYGTSHAEATKPGKQKHGASLPPSESPSDSESGVGVSSSLRSDSSENSAPPETTANPIPAPSMFAPPRAYRTPGERPRITLADVERDVAETERAVGEIAARVKPRPYSTGRIPAVLACEDSTQDRPVNATSGDMASFPAEVDAEAIQAPARPKYPPLFEGLWERWSELRRPNESRAAAAKAGERLVSTRRATWEQLARAVNFYVGHYLENPKDSPSYYPLLATFFGPQKGTWQDWVDGVPSYIADAPDTRAAPMSAQMRAYMGGGR